MNKLNWIPCSEKLPKSGHPVLISIRGLYSLYIGIGIYEDGKNKYEHCPFRIDDYEDNYMEETSYIPKGWYEVSLYTMTGCQIIEDVEVTAWTKLPNCYGANTISLQGG